MCVEAWTWRLESELTCVGFIVKYISLDSIYGLRAIYFSRYNEQTRLYCRTKAHRNNWNNITIEISCKQIVNRRKKKKKKNAEPRPFIHIEQRYESVDGETLAAAGSNNQNKQKVNMSQSIIYT